MLKKSPWLEPSLPNLSYVLRHKEYWPEGFEWDYRYPSSCAIGLCEELYGQRVSQLDGSLEISVGSVRGEGNSFSDIFCNTRETYRVFGFSLWPLVHSDITPEIVADRIDRWLANQ